MEMINHNADFSNAVEAFLAIDKKLRKYALGIGEFKETILTNAKKTERRPIVCLNSSKQAKVVMSMIHKWQEARDHLHEMEPMRYPLNATMFNPEPKIIPNVRSAQTYINTAVNSRLFQASALINRLEKMKISYQRKRESAVYDETIEMIDRDLEFFRLNLGERFRLRTSGYTEVNVLITYEGGEEQKLKVPDIGMFLAPPASVNDETRIKLHQPDEKPQQGVRQKRYSIYDELLPIQTVLPLTGDLYKESEIIKQRALEQERKIREENSK